MSMDRLKGFPEKLKCTRHDYDDQGNCIICDSYAIKNEIIDLCLSAHTKIMQEKEVLLKDTAQTIKDLLVENGQLQTKLRLQKEKMLTVEEMSRIGEIIIGKQHKELYGEKVTSEYLAWYRKEIGICIAQAIHQAQLEKGGEQMDKDYCNCVHLPGYICQVCRKPIPKLALDKTEKEVLYCECKPENRLLCREMECSICHSCDRQLPPKPSPKVELPDPIQHDHDLVANVADLTDGFNKMLDYLRAKGEGK